MASYLVNSQHHESALGRNLCLEHSGTEAMDQVLNSLRLVAFDFDGVFTDNQVTVGEDGAEYVTCCRSDGIGISRLQKEGVITVVISSEQNPVVVQRCKKLQIDCCHGCADKLNVLREVMKRHSIAAEHVAFVGNDINDIDCLKAVGLPICVQDAFDEVKQCCVLVTDRKGGFGAVREICDRIMLARARNSR